MLRLLPPPLNEERDEPPLKELPPLKLLEDPELEDELRNVLLLEPELLLLLEPELRNAPLLPELRYPLVPELPVLLLAVELLADGL